MTKYTLLWATLALLHLWPSHTHGQVDTTHLSPEARSVAAIRTLQGGGLLVRLQSDARKIAAMQDMLQGTHLRPQERSRLARKLDATIAERDIRNQQIADAFAEHFTLCPVYFTYDSIVLAGQPPALIMDATLKPLLEQPLTADRWLALRFGSLDPATTSGAEAMILQDAHLRDLTPPFPYGHKLTNFGFVVNKLLLPDQAFRKNMRRVVLKLERRLIRYNEEPKAWTRPVSNVR